MGVWQIDNTDHKRFTDENSRLSLHMHRSTATLRWKGMTGSGTWLALVNSLYSFRCKQACPSARAGRVVFAINHRGYKASGKQDGEVSD